MEYKIKRSVWGVILEKYTEPKGFFRNTTGPLKVGEITLDDGTEDMMIQDFLTKEKIRYMELGSVKGFDFPYRGEAPRISIGDKKHNIPVEDRIKFIYESLSSNSNYNCLGIKYKDLDSRRHFESIFEIDSVSRIDAYAKEQSWFVDDDDDDDGITTFFINDLL